MTFCKQEFNSPCLHIKCGFMQISAKDLGWLKTDGFCERCFWIKRHDRRLPYQTPFAGFFSSIDSYTKNIVEPYFEKNKRLSAWLDEIGEVQKLIRVKPADFKVKEDGVAVDLNSKPIEEFLESMSKSENLDKKTLEQYRVMEWSFKHINLIIKDTAFLLGFFKADILWKVATYQDNAEFKERGL